MRFELELSNISVLLRDLNRMMGFASKNEQIYRMLWTQHWTVDVRFSVRVVCACVSGSECLKDRWMSLKGATCIGSACHNRYLILVILSISKGRGWFSNVVMLSVMLLNHSFLIRCSVVMTQNEPLSYWHIIYRTVVNKMFLIITTFW